jgi:hypothetical protein
MQENYSKAPQIIALPLFDKKASNHNSISIQSPDFWDELSKEQQAAIKQADA